MNSRCVAVVAGSADIHRPVFNHLSARLAEPVQLVEWSNLDELNVQLTRLGALHSTWIVPCNELALNAVFNCGALNGRHAENLHVPGTGKGGLSASDLSNKLKVAATLEGWKPSRFRCANTSTRRGALAAALPELVFPCVVKPASKDAQDAFTKAFPKKMLVLRSSHDLEDVVVRHEALLSDGEWILQELLLGEPISWCGAIQGGAAKGVEVRSLCRSPAGRLGGTATLVEVGAASATLQAAVEELANRLGLDGLFEIEFVMQGGSLTFFHELNPRPFLQISAVLDFDSDHYCRYFTAKGFLSAETGKRSSRRKRWGSAERYLTLTDPHDVRTRMLVKTLISDVRLTRHYSACERVLYLATIGRMIRRS